MAAAGLAEILGDTAQQSENAAEIVMEPSPAWSRLPCIERNAISAGKAINAARMALRGDGTHRVSLDQVLETMRPGGSAPRWPPPAAAPSEQCQKRQRS